MHPAPCVFFRETLEQIDVERLIIGQYDVVCAFGWWSRSSRPAAP